MRELLATLVKTAEIRLCLLMNDLVGADISTLGESLPADFTMVWPFARVATFMGL